MKKSLKLYILFVVLIIALTACKQEPKPAPEPAPEKEYKIGDIGPAGGYIFYDCDADNDTGNEDGLISTEVGWRYLEAAPADLRVVDRKPTVDRTVNGYSGASINYIFGYYRNSDSGSNLYVNGTTTYKAADCTGTEIGTGKKNTELIVKAMGYSAYILSSGARTTGNYAANLCLNLVYNEYDDWFLPSKDELNLMYENLKKEGVDEWDGDFGSQHYWSSSEYDNTTGAWAKVFGNGLQSVNSRDTGNSVRPVRAFMSADYVPVHKHTYSSAWTTDETYHWHTATCEHTDEISGKAEHSFTDWIVTKEATYSQTGIQTRFCSVCGYEESEEVPAIPGYLVGDIGPAGGYIFYDCDADNDTGNADGLISTEVGWNYLEAAPADLRVVNGVPTVDRTVNGYSVVPTGYVFGYYRNSDTNRFVNGTTTYDVADCTGTAIGTGKTNTRLLVDAMGNEAYSDYSGSNKTADYAARLCDILTYTVNGITYDDWFLPSKDELNQMYVNLKENGLGGFAYGNYYWSSSESYNNVYYAWEQYFSNGDQYDYFRYYNDMVRPVRAF